MHLLSRTALATALLAVAPLAIAASHTATDQFDVSITIENSCTVLVGDLVFPTSNTLATAINGSTTGAVTCTGIGSYTVGFDDGTGIGATFGTRKMTGATDTIDYVLARDSAHTEVLGDGSTGTVTIGGTSVGNNVADASFTIYGQVMGSQNPKPTGTYTDTVTATVTF